MSFERHAEDLAGGHGVDVEAVAEGLLQRLDVGDMGEQAQLDLGVVGAQQHMALLGDEGLADAPALLGPDRDVLQVGVGRRQPPGRGRRHGEGGVDPARVRVDLLDQGVGIGALQLGQLAPFQHLDRQFVALGGQGVEHVRAGRVGAGLALLAAAVQAHLVEQHLAQLLGRADGEGVAGQLVDLLLQLLDAPGEVAGHALQLDPVDLDAVHLHLGDHRDQRALDRLVDRVTCSGGRRGFSACHRRRA